MVSNKSAILLRHAWCQQRVLDCCERRQHNLLQLWGWFRRWLLVAIIVCLVGSKVTSHGSHVGTHQSLTAKTSISNVHGMGLLQLLLHVLQKPHCVHQPSTSLIPAPGGEKLEWALPRAK
jgi:hypothetical protein